MARAAVGVAVRAGAGLGDGVGLGGGVGGNVGLKGAVGVGLVPPTGELEGALSWRPTNAPTAVAMKNSTTSATPKAIQRNLSKGTTPAAAPTPHAEPYTAHAGRINLDGYPSACR